MQTTPTPNNTFSHYVGFNSIVPFSLVYLLCKIALIWSFPQPQDQRLKNTFKQFDWRVKSKFSMKWYIDWSVFKFIKNKPSSFYRWSVIIRELSFDLTLNTNNWNFLGYLDAGGRMELEINKFSKVLWNVIKFHAKEKEVVNLPNEMDLQPQPSGWFCWLPYWAVHVTSQDDILHLLTPAIKETTMTTATTV